MKWLSNVLDHPRYQHFMSNSVLLNWSNTNKSILVLVLGAMGHLMWIAWYLYSFATPEHRQWMNVDFYQQHLHMLLLFMLGYLSLILVCLICRRFERGHIILPYVCIFYFATTFMHGGYCIGLISPATIASIISLVSVGLVLFERKIIYSALLPMLGFLILATSYTVAGEWRYAPVFDSNLINTGLYTNRYWVMSMLYLYMPVFVIGMVLYEITLIQWRNRERQIDELSYTDPLTGISNRRSITHSLNEAQKRMYDYALVLLDLDHFKKINDFYGHEAGDYVLQRIAKILKMSLREQDSVGRFGGEEFILILRENNLDRAIEIAERCRKEIETAHIPLLDGRYLQVTASFGVALSHPEYTKEDVIRLADQALYVAKADGRNVVRYALPIAAQMISA